MRVSSVCLVAVMQLMLGVAWIQAQSEPGAMIGAGNFTNGEVNDGVKSQIRTLKALGAGMCRINLYPDTYLVSRNWDKPNEHAIDAIMAELHTAGIKPMLLLEYYSHYRDEKGLGTEAQWKVIGEAFARRYRPGGQWATENKITDGFGITLYTAFNEPEPTDFRLGGKYGPKPYVESLRGLAAGVHSVDAKLQVAPGGFMAANAWKDYSLRGIGPAIAPLVNDGTLAGIDLHTYYDVEWAPMERGYASSAQDNFDRVKLASGITRDCVFFCTEFNFKFRKVDAKHAARGMFTGIWDHLAIVGNDGRSLAASFAFPWNLFHAPNEDGEFGMREVADPYTPDARAAVLRDTLALTAGSRVVAADPRTAGMIILRGGGKTIWVWQNRAGWTDTPGTEIELTGIPLAATRIEIHAWDGLRGSVDVTKPGSVKITGLDKDQTYLFIARAQDQRNADELLPPRSAKRKTLADMDAALRVDKLPQRYSVAAHETFDRETPEAKGWNTGVEGSPADPALAVKIVPNEDRGGTCALLTYAFTPANRGCRLLLSSFTGNAAPQGTVPWLSFQIRGDKPGRQVRIRIYDRDNETIVTKPIAVDGAWRLHALDLSKDIAEKWGEHSNGVIDWPLRAIGFEVLSWGGDTQGPTEHLWLEDLKLVQPEP